MATKQSEDKSMGINIISFSARSHSPATHLIIIVFFFLIIFLATLLFIHFFCRRKTRSNTTTTVAVPVPVIGLGLDAAIIASIPIILHGALMEKRSEDNDDDDNNNEEKEEECSICLAMFEDDEKVKVLPECLHAYHSDCVDKWLENQSNCPLCRSSIDSTDSNAAQVVINVHQS